MLADLAPLAAGIPLRGFAPAAPPVDLPSGTLVINATSAGHSGAVPRLPPKLFADGGVAYDLNYGQAAVPFMVWAKADGAAAVAAAEARLA